MLPHQAGKISNSIWSNPQSVAEDQDLQNGYVVGQDNYTGETIASDGSTTTKGQSDQDLELGKPVDILRPNSAQKARKTVFKFATFRTIRVDSGSDVAEYSDGDAEFVDVSSCGSLNEEGGGYTFPEPPEEPPEEPPIDEIPPTEISPLIPEACQEPIPTITIKKPESDKYYAADSISDPCPIGMIKAGYVDFGDGEIYIQCKGESFDSGVAVPVDPTTYGYDCSPCGTCIKTKGGKYPTLEICQQSGCNPVTYTCTASGCVAVFDGSGEFTSLEQCQNSCSAVPYACVDGNCIQTLDGKFATLEECEAVCGVSPTIYRISLQYGSYFHGWEIDISEGLPTLASDTIALVAGTSVCGLSANPIYYNPDATLSLPSLTYTTTLFSPDNCSNPATFRVFFINLAGVLHYFVSTNPNGDVTTITNFTVTPL